MDKWIILLFMIGLSLTITVSHWHDVTKDTLKDTILRVIVLNIPIALAIHYALRG